MTTEFAVPEWIRPLADGRLRLVGQRCRACGTHAFPRTARCPRCASPELDEALLGPEATLYSVTVDRANPTDAHHAIVGQARFDDGAYVQGYVLGDRNAPPRTGERVEVVRYAFTPFGEGEPATTYGFRSLERADA